MAQATVKIDFNSAKPFSDHLTYSEDGYTLTTNVGKVRINDAFQEGNNSAQPSFGFGQGMNSNFVLKHGLDRPFAARSIDLLEATGAPAAYGVTITGKRKDSSTVTQTFTLDGIAGPQTFVFSSGFKDLVLLKIEEDAGNTADTDVVMIDNVRLREVVTQSSGVAVYAGTLSTRRIGSGKEVLLASEAFLVFDTGVDRAALIRHSIRQGLRLYRIERLDDFAVEHPHGNIESSRKFTVFAKATTETDSQGHLHVDSVFYRGLNAPLPAGTGSVLTAPKAFSYISRRLAPVNSVAGGGAANLREETGWLTFSASETAKSNGAGANLEQTLIRLEAALRTLGYTRAE